MSMETWVIVLTVIAVAASLWPRQLPVPLLVVLGAVLIAGYANLFAAFLQDQKIDLVEMIQFALASATFALAATRFSWTKGVVAVLAAAAVLVLHGRIYQNYLVDDAFISFRYAQNLAAGHGVVWNIGEHVEGYTNFLWVLILTPFEKFGWDTPEASRWLGFAATVTALPIGFLMLREWSRGRPHEEGVRWAQAGYALLLPTCGGLTMYAFSGMETALFATLVLGSTLLVVWEDRREDKGPPWSAGALVLAALARFDGALLFLPAAALKGWGVVRRRNRQSVIRFATWTAALVLPYAAYFGWQWAYYGYPFPNTFYAKVEPDPSAIDQFERGIRYLDAFAHDYAALVTVPAFISLAVHWPPRQSLYVASVLVGWGAYVVVVGGDFMAQDRFFVPVVPLLYLLAADGVIVSVWAARQHVDWRPLVGAGAAMLLGAMVINLAVSQIYIGLIRSESATDSDRRRIGVWLRDNVPDDYLILVDPAGSIPYYSRLPAIDNLGINDETIAHTKTAGPGQEKAGHEKSNGQYAISRQPDLFIDWHGLVSAPWDEKFWQSGTSPTRAGRDFLAQPAVLELYETRSVQLEGRWFNYLELREHAR